MSTRFLSIQQPAELFGSLTPIADIASQNNPLWEQAIVRLGLRLGIKSGTARRILHCILVFVTMA
jgi:hypothetical protein